MEKLQTQKQVSISKAGFECGIQGKVYVTFVVEKDGSISGIRVIRGIGGGCDEEAMRLVSLFKFSKVKNRRMRVKGNDYGGNFFLIRCFYKL